MIEAIQKLCPMTEEEKKDCVFKDGVGYREPWGVFDKTRRKSAEISFKAGYDKRESEFVYNPDYLDFDKGVETGRELGIREVVEWMYEPCPHAPKHFPSDKRMCVNCCEVKLKEWGIK